MNISIPILTRMIAPKPKYTPNELNELLAKRKGTGLWGFKSRKDTPPRILKLNEKILTLIEDSNVEKK